MKQRPFLKWAGNKFSLLTQLERVLPSGKRLIEPFAGSGAVFLNQSYRKYIIAEKNNDLVTLYQFVKDEGQDFIDYVKQWIVPENNNADRFYALREEFNMTTDLRLKSALFIYLNRHGFNGLCRYNQKGIYNAPFGRYDKIYFPEKALKYFHERSQQAKFYCQGFEKTLKMAKIGDVVYCDPPYVSLTKTASFTTYHSGGFGEDEQVLLATWAIKLANRGIPVVVSNHDTAFTRELYRGAQLISVPVHRYISADPKARKPVKELIAIFN